MHRQCAPPPAGHPALAERDRVLGAFLSGSKLGTRQRKLILQELLHGDPRRDMVEYCSPLPNPDIGAWATAVASALLPCGIAVFNRNRWLKSVGMLQDVCLLASMHGVLRRAVPPWVRRLRGERPEFAPPAELMRAPGAAHPGEDVGDPMVVWDAEGAGGAQQEKRPGEDWAEYNARQRSTAWQFATSPVASADLAVASVTLRPQADLMSKLLYIASDEWLSEARVQAHVTGAPLATRVGVCHCPGVTGDFFAEIDRLASAEGPWLCVKEHTWRSFGLAFAELASACGGTAALLRDRHKSYPFKLLSLADCLLADADARAGSILEDRPCVRDDFSNRWVARFSTVESLAGADSLALLRCIARMCRCETSRNECRHAAVRRSLQSSSATHAGSLERTSASYVLMRQRIVERTLGPPASAPQGLAAAPTPVRKRHLKRRRGGGGTQRAFISRFLRGKGKRFTKTAERRTAFTEAGQAYREWKLRRDPADTAEIRLRGRAGTVTHRAGRSAFCTARPRQDAIAMADPSGDPVAQLRSKLASSRQAAMEESAKQLAERARRHGQIVEWSDQQAMASALTSMPGAFDQDRAAARRGGAGQHLRADLGPGPRDQTRGV